jgi:hypothetical protein
VRIAMVLAGLVFVESLLLEQQLQLLPDQHRVAVG